MGGNGGWGGGGVNRLSGARFLGWRSMNFDLFLFNISVYFVKGTHITGHVGVIEKDEKIEPSSYSTLPPHPRPSGCRRPWPDSSAPHYYNKVLCH